MMLIDGEDATSPVHKMLISLNKLKVSNYVESTNKFKAIYYCLHDGGIAADQYDNCAAKQSLITDRKLGQR